jgi:hypothetical protein
MATEKVMFDLEAVACPRAVWACFPEVHGDAKWARQERRRHTPCAAAPHTECGDYLEPKFLSGCRRVHISDATPPRRGKRCCPSCFPGIDLDWA